MLDPVTQEYRTLLEPALVVGSTTGWLGSELVKRSRVKCEFIEQTYVIPLKSQYLSQLTNINFYPECQCMIFGLKLIESKE